MGTNKNIVREGFLLTTELLESTVVVSAQALKILISLFQAIFLFVLTCVFPRKMIPNLGSQLSSALAICIVVCQAHFLVDLSILALTHVFFKVMGGYILIKDEGKSRLV